MTVSLPTPLSLNLTKKYQVLPLPKDIIPPSKIPGKQQIRWIGCSDSSVEETDVLDVPREEFFVHRNFGNIVSNGDLSSGSAVAWCLELLKVRFASLLGPLLKLLDLGLGMEG